MSNEIKIKGTDGTPLNLDDLVVDDGNHTGGGNGLIHTSTSQPILNPYWQPEAVSHHEEIAELKKEIQALKDMIAEHILLGHQDT